jgi:hypothetical protein
MRIGFLRMVSTGDPFRYFEFAELARTMGLEVEWPDFGDLQSAEHAKRGWAQTERLLKEADAFVLDRFPLPRAPELALLFHKRIDSGAHAVVFPHHGDRSSLEDWTHFLARYYVRPSWVKLVGPADERTGLIFRRDEDCLRSPELFTGVDAVVADSPFALWYGGEAWAVLVGAPSHWGVEASTDFPDDWNGREMACMAVWYGHSGGALIVASAYGILTDPVTPPRAGHSSGLANNRALARNLLRFLSHAKQSGGATPEDLCKRIEINLVDFVFGVLKPLGDGWWVDHIPLSIRQKASARQEEEGNRRPKEAYLDLIDLKAIIANNWRLFEPHFLALGSRGGKDKSLQFLDRLNEVRRLVGHPLKMHVSGYSFSPDERTLLVEADRLALDLAARVRPRESPQH